MGFAPFGFNYQHITALQNRLLDFDYNLSTHFRYLTITPLGQTRHCRVWSPTIVNYFGFSVGDYPSVRIPLKRSHAKRHPWGCLFAWRKRWDSNPRYVAVYLISSQGRYDHFDTLPYSIAYLFYNTFIAFASFCRRFFSLLYKIPATALREYVTKTVIFFFCKRNGISKRISLC